MNNRYLQSDIVFLGNGKFIENGILEVDGNGMVIEVYAGSPPKEKVEYYPGALCPGFINTHCHLELTYLIDKIKPKGRLVNFIRSLQNMRQHKPENNRQLMQEADQAMYESGTVAVGDISNSNDSFPIKNESAIKYHTFIELFGFDDRRSESILSGGLALKKQASAAGLPASVVPHSPYSVSGTLLQKITLLGDNDPISIHNQETAAENEMFRQSKGELMEMLQSFGLDTSKFKAPATSSLQSYLPAFTNRKILLVHNTFMEELDMVSLCGQEKVYLALCPKANLYIEDRLPLIEQFYEKGLKCTIGTDSLASNTSLSILEEIKTIQQLVDLPTEILIEWACKNGADFLGFDELGTFESGKKPGVVHIDQLEGRKISRKSTAKLLVPA
jgi:cytosine/adenosine deaminase-related metal-dependent hydrolase